LPEGKNWVDFKQIRESVDILSVLESYRVELRVKGHQAQGFCPLPSHEGQRRSPSFSVHLKKGVWQCFGCGAKGNVIDLAARMEGLDPDRKEDIRKAALLLQERFLNCGDDPPGERECKPANRRVVNAGSGQEPKPRSKDDPSEPASPEAEPDDNRPRVVNALLNFELKRLDQGHPYLRERKLTPETIAHFGIGFCKQGMMQDRIAIPLHDTEGSLIGYAGRIVDDAKIGKDCPKYLLPGERERDGTLYEFRKSRFLFNGHRIGTAIEDLIVLEGFFGVFWLHQCGWKNVVALMGATCSPEQASLIVRMTDFDSRVWIMTDGDAAGVRCAQSVFNEVAPDRFVRWLKLEEKEQPEDCDADRLFEMLAMPVK